MKKNIVEGRRKGNIVEYKINKYPNAQQPGTLWYHDHAMSVTKANVAMGLYGFYLIRNHHIESCLPHDQDEKFLLLSQLKSDPSKDFTTMSSSNFFTNRHYRLRILNGNFVSGYTISFEILEPADKSKNLVEFRFIGSDSAIRNKISEKFTEVTLTPAERTDIIL